MVSDVPSSDDATGVRLRILGIVALALFGALFARLWYLQVLEHETLQVRAQANVIRVVTEPAPRGRILDRNGRVLVDNRVVDVVTVDPEELAAGTDGADQRRSVLLALARTLSRSGTLVKLTDIEAALADPQYGPFESVPVAVDVADDLLVYLGERPDLFPGVRVEQRTVRSYPYGTLAAHVLGYVGPITGEEYAEVQGRWDPADPEGKAYRRDDEIGKTGVERMFEDELRGIPGRRVYEVDRRGEIVREILSERRDPVPGNDVWLTVDIDVQALVESQLERGLARARAIGELAASSPDAEDHPDIVGRAGAAVALDPRDGTVVAMASYPTYDPGDFVGGISARLFAELTDPANHSPILNRAIQGTYSPGSTFKPFTAIAALSEGVIGTDGVFRLDETYDDTGVYTYPFCSVDSDTCVFSSPFRGARAVDLRRALTVSSDTYFYKLAGEGFFQLPRGRDEAIQTTARAFGFGSPTGVALPYERSGVVPDRAYLEEGFSRGVFIRDQWYAGDTINLAIGQGDLVVTPLQLANAYAALANGGVVHQPNLAWRVTAPDGSIVREIGPRVRRDLDLPDWQRQPIIDGLLGVTSDPDGTAYEAFNRPELGGVDFPLETWPVAGKTGTSEKAGKADTALFVGFGPVDDPRRGIDVAGAPSIVVAAVLEESGFGGAVAAPVVSHVLEPVAEGDVPVARTTAEIAEEARRRAAESLAAADGGGTP
ncbi:MAG: penicillin-binding protein 2 [Actinomyces sp.]|nr:MAG: penicillin-binding protein 2 [Actinomyces sp.]